MLKTLNTLIIFICALTAFAQTGENCQTAIFVDSDNCSAIADFDNSGIAGITKGSCNATGTNNSMWFSFIAGASIVQVDIIGNSLNNPIATVFNANNGTCSQSSNFTEIYCGISGSNELNFTLNNLVVSQVYYLLIDGNGNNTGSFQVCMRSNSTPFNDEMCNAITLPTKNFCTPYGSYSNSGATEDLITGNSTFYPPCFDNNPLNGVWFKFVANTNYIKITTTGSPNGLNNPQIALLTPPGNDCARTDYSNFTQVDCDQNNDNSHQAQIINNSLTIGQTYYLLVDGLSTNMGFFNICVEEEQITGVANDFCDDAIDLCPYQTISGTTVGATNTNDIPNTLWNGCNIETNDMVYYRFGTGATVNDVTLDIAYECTGAKIQVAVFEPTATPCSGLNDNWNNIICVEEGLMPQFQIVVPAASLSPNTTYYLVIDDYPNYECSFDLTIKGNAGPKTGVDQQKCLSASAFNMSGYSPPGGVWSGPGIINASTGLFSPSIAGLGNHTVFYQIGACYDTKNITVSTADVFVSRDQEICMKDTTQIFGQAFPRPSRLIKTFENDTEGDLSDNVSSFTRNIAVTSIEPNVFDANNSLVKVCVNIVHMRAKDLQIYLKAPSGQQVLLTRANGSAGFQYLNTCFVPQADISITDNSQGSFNGNFLPEESFDILNGASVNGTWSLVIDDLSSNNNGTYYSWSISFFDKNTLNTSISPWSPNIKISDRNINNPLVFPDANQTYTFIALDQANCSSNKSIDIDVVQSEVITINATSTSICEGDSVKISIQAPVGKTYDVTISDGTNDFTKATAQNGDFFILYPTTTSDYQLSSAALVGVGISCVIPDDKIIRVNVRTLPYFTFDNIINACEGYSININYYFFPTEPLSFVIDTGNSDIVKTNFDSNPYQFTIVANQNFEYKVKELSYDNAPYCIVYPNEGTQVIIPDAPVINISGDSLYCEGATAIVNVVIDQPDFFDLTASINGTDTLLSNIKSPYQLTVPASGTTDILFKYINNNDIGCGYDISIPFQFKTVDPLSYEILSDTCYADREGALIRFQISGGVPNTYFVNGTPSGAIFEEYVLTGNNFNFAISDDSPCPTVFYSGAVDCSCKSDAGLMSEFPFFFCENDTVRLDIPEDNIPENSFQEPDDTLVFMLHTGTRDVLGTVLDLNFDASFTFKPQNGMVVNTEYYVSSVVGNALPNYPWVDTLDQCLSTQGTRVTFTSKPTIQLSGPDSICLGEEALINISITGNAPFDMVYQINNDSYNLNNISENEIIAISPTTANTFKVTKVSSANPTCNIYPDSTLEIKVIDRPVATNVTINCNPDLESFQVIFDVVGGDPNNYSVIGTDGAFSPPGSARFESTNLLSPANYEFIIENNSSCPDDVVKGFKNCYCISSPGNMDETTVSVCENNVASAIYDYQYIFDDNDSLTFILHDKPDFEIGQILAQNNVPVFGFQTGMNYNTTYYISAVVGNYDPTTAVDFNDGCTIAAKGTPVVFKQQPSVAPINDITACKGSNINIPISLNGTAPYTITYNTDTENGTWVVNNDEDVITINTLETKTFYLTNISDNNTPKCSTPLNMEIKVTVVPVPSIVFSYNDSICEGNSVTLETLISGNAPFSFDIINSQGFSASFSGLSTNDVVEFSPPISGVYKIVGLSDQGSPTCTNDSVFNFPITVFQKPNISMTASDVCAGDSVAVQLNFEGNAPFFITIQDDQQGTTDQDTTFYQVLNSDTTIFRSLTDSANVFVYRYYDNNVLNCPIVGSLPSIFVNVNPKPSIAINFNETICSGESINIPLTISGNGPFDVQLSINGDIQDLVIYDSDPYIPFTPAVTSTYFFKNIVDRTSTACSATGIDTAFVTVNPKPTGTLSAKSVICQNSVLDVDIKIQGSPTFSYTLTWLNESITQFNNGTSTEQIILSESTWVYLTELMDGATPQCTKAMADSLYVTVNTLPKITLLSKPEVCKGDPWVVTTEGSGSNPFTLKFKSTPESFIFNNIGLSDTIIFYPDTNNTYILTQISDNASPTCFATPNDTLRVKVIPKPNVSFTSTDKDGCSPWLVEFSAEVDLNDVSGVNWRFEDGATSTKLNMPHTFPAGLYQVTLTAFGKNGCINTHDDNVHSYELPKPDFSMNPNPVGSLNPTVTFYDDVSNGFPKKWIFDTLATDTSNFPATFTFPLDNQGEYRVWLVASNQYGCPDSTFRNLQVIGELTIYVPNAFSPNGDGLNDVFTPVINGLTENSYRLK
ncbi:MAG: subtilisin-like proprotein convertase family protein, partial [Flavobacteriales bacterium]